MKTDKSLFFYQIFPLLIMVVLMLNTPLKSSPMLPGSSTFTAEVLHGHEVMLQWNHHATPKSVKHYIIQRSVDGENFESLKQSLSISSSGPCMVVDHLEKATTYYYLKGVTRSDEVIFLGMVRVDSMEPKAPQAGEKTDRISLVAHH